MKRAARCFVNTQLRSRRCARRFDGNGQQLPIEWQSSLMLAIDLFASFPAHTFVKSVHGHVRSVLIRSARNRPAVTGDFRVRTIVTSKS
jgi:hypothetical protein